jgi:diadenosine tetraphosphate (Ap4A) HIT family hydrolase
MRSTICEALLHNSADIIDWPLCKVLLKNEINYPWLLLVPRKEGVNEITDLSASDQAQLMREINAAATFLKTYFSADKINVASIGNQVPQLHGNPPGN